MFKLREPLYLQNLSFLPLLGLSFVEREREKSFVVLSYIINRLALLLCDLQRRVDLFRSSISNCPYKE